jgi:hypothetical protein
MRGTYSTRHEKHKKKIYSKRNTWFWVVIENLDVEIKSLVGVSFDFKGYFSFFGEIRNSRTSLHRYVNGINYI